VARRRKFQKFPRREHFHRARLILCSQHNRAVAHYTIDRLSDKILAAEYRLALPDEKILVAEVERTQAALDQRTPIAVAKKAKPIAKKAKRKGSSR